MGRRLVWVFRTAHLAVSASQDDHAGALREAQLLDSLDHPNIIKYRESFVDKDGSLCIVTSFCEEGDLFNRIRKKATQKEFFREDEVMNMFVQVGTLTECWCCGPGRHHRLIQ